LKACFIAGPIIQRSLTKIFFVDFFFI